jgi:putative DNA primase/helicase
MLDLNAQKLEQSGVSPENKFLMGEVHTLEDRDLTDVGNAVLFVKMHSSQARYCPHTKKWFVWDGRRWKQDVELRIESLAREVTDKLLVIADEEMDPLLKVAITRHALRTMSKERLRAMIELARSEPACQIRPDQMDQNPVLLNVVNGTLNLLTGTLQPHNPENYITKLANVKFDPAAKCPRWVSFLNEIFKSNQNLTMYVQKVLGYSVSGETKEQAFFIFLGRGANGKSTMLNLIADLLSDEYVAFSPVSTIAEHRFEGSIRNDLARLHDVRIVIFAETNVGQRIDESLLKLMTGGEKITARFLRQEFIEFKPQFKPFIATNNMFSIRGKSDAIWRRLQIIPFRVTFSPDERDGSLPETLKTEAAGILNWLVAGFQKWSQEGLGTQDEIAQTTESYRQELDTIGRFLAECTTICEGLAVGSSDLYQGYVDWCRDNGESKTSIHDFSRSVEDRGYVKARGHGGRFRFKSLTLVKDEEAEEHDSM